MEIYCRTAQTTDNNKGHAHYMPDTWVCKHTLRIYNTYYFSPATVVSWMCLSCYLLPCFPCLYHSRSLSPLVFPPMSFCFPCLYHSRSLSPLVFPPISLCFPCLYHSTSLSPLVFPPISLCFPLIIFIFLPVSSTIRKFKFMLLEWF